MKYPLMRNNILREDLDSVIEHLKKDDPILTNGPYVKDFEKKWSEWLGVKYSVFVNSGASANLLSMAVLKNFFPDGGEIIVPPLTWISDISSVIQNGFTPIFVDVDFATLGMNPESILNKINKNTRAIFLSHIQGFDALDNDLLKHIEEKGIYLIEDVCESHGATHDGLKAGTFGLMSNFSFYYAHHMTTIEGGMVSTNDESIYQMLRILRSHGMVREATTENHKRKWKEKYPDLNPEFIFAYPAYNLRNTEIGAIMGLKQLCRLDSNISKRNLNHEYFIKNLNSEIYFTNFKMNGSSNYAFNIILNEKDDDLVHKLTIKMKENGIEFRRGSAGGGNHLRQPYLKNLFPDGYHNNFPNTEHIHFYGFYIGNFPSLEIQDIKEILDVLNHI